MDQRYATAAGSGELKKYVTIPHPVTAVQYDGGDVSRRMLAELCGHWIMFVGSIPHVTTGRGLVQVRLMDWVARCDDKDVFGFSVVPAGVFEKYYKVDNG